MSRQLHRSVIKEQLAPFWVDMCHLLSLGRLPRSLHFFSFSKGGGAEGAVDSRNSFPDFTPEFPNWSIKKKKGEGGENPATAQECKNATLPLSLSLSHRQFNQCFGQARYLPATEAGDVLPANHCDGQRQPAHEQHQHLDHPSVRVQ